MTSPHPRSTTYYWKCDRPAAFHGTEERDRTKTGYEPLLENELRRVFLDREISVVPAAAQGNHLTFYAAIGGVERFVRVDDGPEHDDMIEVESRILSCVRELGLPAPRVYAVDASRARVPFAWQVMDRVAATDLNQAFKAGTLDTPRVFREIGAAVARWQSLTFRGFGPFDPAALREENRLHGFHSSYADFFHLHLERHLDYLTAREFLRPSEAEAMRQAVARHRDLLNLAEGCLVHKDLALWNILGTTTAVAAYIDWDDAIAGDALEDLALLGCFHDAATIAAAVNGYESVRPLPTEHRRRFWLHLLRNMIMKSVIRVGAGYFDRSDTFFLIGSGSGGTSLKQFTRERLAKSLAGLRTDAPLSQLA